MCEPSETEQFDEAIRLSILEQEKINLEQEQRRADEEDVQQARISGSRFDDQYRSILERKLEKVKNEIDTAREQRWVCPYNGSCAYEVGHRKGKALLLLFPQYPSPSSLPQLSSLFPD